jgi:N-acetylmuramoyl-L-alanine amidase
MLLATVLLGWLSAPSAVEKSLTVYSAQTTFSVPLSERDGNTYVDLQSVLEKLGPVSASIDGNRLKLRFRNGDNEAQFTDGATDARVGRSRVAMAAPFHLENHRPQVPLRSLSDLLGRLLGMRADYREASQRLFVGVSPVHFVADLKRGQPSALVLSFSAPVSPQISAEGARLKLTFSRDPLTGGPQNWRFDDPLIISAAYAEDVAPPEISVTGSEPLLASFSDSGRTITISAAPKASVEVSPATPPAAPPAPPSASTPIASQNSPASPGPQPGANVAGTASPPPLPDQSPAVRQRFLLLLDAGHGGDERGAALNEDVLEKDVNLAIARRLRAELQNRGVTVFMLRDGDQTISLDRRAETANALRPGLYLALHSASLGRGVRIYTSALPPAPSSRSVTFAPWATAQAGYVSASVTLATALLDELSNNPFRIPVGLMPAPVRPLNNIAGAAVAIEVSPQRDDVASLSEPDYQQSVAVALATAIAALRPQLEQSR